MHVVTSSLGYGLEFPIGFPFFLPECGLRLINILQIPIDAVESIECFFEKHLTGLIKGTKQFLRTSRHRIPLSGGSSHACTNNSKLVTDAVGITQNWH